MNSIQFSTIFSFFRAPINWLGLAFLSGKNYVTLIKHATANSREPEYIYIYISTSDKIMLPSPYRKPIATNLKLTSCLYGRMLH